MFESLFSERCIIQNGHLFLFSGTISVLRQPTGATISFPSTTSSFTSAVLEFRIRELRGNFRETSLVLLPFFLRSLALSD